MFNYQLSEPRRPFASALQATFIHASLIAGAVFATKAAPVVLQHPRDPIYVLWPVSPVRRASVPCGCVISLPQGPATVPQVPEVPDVPLPGGSPQVDPTTVIDDRGLSPFAGDPRDTVASGTSIFAETAVDDPPALLAAGLLRYPAILDAARVEGSVTLSFVIDAEGRVERDGIEVVSATDTGFVPAAKEAVLTSRFHPAMKAHLPVRVRVQQVIAFKH